MSEDFNFKKEDFNNDLVFNPGAMAWCERREVFLPDSRRAAFIIPQVKADDDD